MTSVARDKCSISEIASTHTSAAVRHATANKHGGHHCAGAARALIWRANSLRVSKVEYNSYFGCVESGGAEEKDYWIMGHEN
jgi:hypothetical protein